MGDTKPRGPALLVAWRDGAGLTQADAAELVGVGQNTWSDWENEKRSPRVEQALAIALATEGGVPVEAWADDAKSARAIRAAKEVRKRAKRKAA